MSGDAKLVDGLKQKSSAAFNELYNKYYKLVYFQAFQILNNKEDAEDVMQNTFIKIMNNIESIDNNCNLKQYLSLISKNEAIDLYRKKKKRKEVYDENVINNLKSQEDDKDFELIITLNNTLEKNEALILSYKIIYDYTFNEIASELNIPLGTVFSKYLKAINKLKKYYKEGKL